MKKANPDFNKLFSLVKEGTDLGKSKGSENILVATIKCGEELGELCAEVLKYVDYKKSKETNKSILKKIKSEGTDAIIAILNVLNLVDTEKQEIIDHTTSAVEKWKQKHLKTNGSKRKNK